MICRTIQNGRVSLVTHDADHSILVEVVFFQGLFQQIGDIKRDFFIVIRQPADFDQFVFSQQLSDLIQGLWIKVTKRRGGFQAMLGQCLPGFPLLDFFGEDFALGGGGKIHERVVGCLGIPQGSGLLI